MAARLIASIAASVTQTRGAPSVPRRNKPSHPPVGESSPVRATFLPPVTAAVRIDMGRPHAAVRAFAKPVLPDRGAEDELPEDTFRQQNSARSPIPAKGCRRGCATARQRGQEAHDPATRGLQTRFGREQSRRGPRRATRPRETRRHRDAETSENTSPFAVASEDRTSPSLMDHDDDVVAPAVFEARRVLSFRSIANPALSSTAAQRTRVLLSSSISSRLHFSSRVPPRSGLSCMVPLPHLAGPSGPAAKSEGGKGADGN